MTVRTKKNPLIDRTPNLICLAHLKNYIIKKIVSPKFYFIKVESCVRDNRNVSCARPQTGAIAVCYVIGLCYILVESEYAQKPDDFYTKLYRKELIKDFDFFKTELLEQLRNPFVTSIRNKRDVVSSRERDYAARISQILRAHLEISKYGHTKHYDFF